MYLIFFFKQKTAYERRISDWSSDVCSSDLPAPQAATAAPATPAWVEKSNAGAQVLIAAQAKFQPEGFSFFGIPGYDDKVADLGQIGRASCRERVGRYVSIAVVSVPFKKKTK